MNSHAGVAFARLDPKRCEGDWIIRCFSAERKHCRRNARDCGLEKVTRCLPYQFKREPLTQDEASSVAGHTPAYAAPEQIDGLKPEPPDDLYALGATLYRMLLYECLSPPLPFTASVRNAAIANGKLAPLQLAHEINPQISPNVEFLLTIYRNWNKSSLS